MPCWPTSPSRRSSTYHWVTPGEMLDGLGMAETTPGPLIMVTQFVGFLAAWRDRRARMPPLLAATLGGLLTTWVTFTPCFLWIFFGAPFVEALRANKALGAALGAITAAVVGVILNLAVWFGLHVLFATIVPMHFLGATVGVPVLSSVDVPSLVLAARRGGRDLPLQDRHDPGAAGERADRHDLLPRRPLDLKGRAFGARHRGRRPVRLEGAGRASGSLAGREHHHSHDPVMTQGNGQGRSSFLTRTRNLPVEDQPAPAM